MSERTHSSNVSHTDDADRLLTFRQGCDMLGIGVRLGWSMVNRGELPHLRVGRLIRFRRASLLDWIARQERKAGRG